MDAAFDCDPRQPPPEADVREDDHGCASRRQVRQQAERLCDVPPSQRGDTSPQTEVDGGVRSLIGPEPRGDCDRVGEVVGAMPAFRAAAGPRFGCRMQRSRGSSPARASAVPSVEPSSTTISSKSENVCARTLRTARTTHSRRWYVGTIIETAGMRRAAARRVVVIVTFIV
jgi:hypothetical protein